ncbi:hypothetical protein [Pinibacter aurantiacus]|nr:hypothetical protein [Pinibacter aurantiacus]
MMNLLYDRNIIHSQEPGKPSRRKQIYPVNDELRDYLIRWGREVSLPVSYDDLLHFRFSIPRLDKDGNDTHWETVSYDMREWEYLREGLVKIYAILKIEGNNSYNDHLDVASIDYCPFGNSRPFRIRIINRFNDNCDHYYIKQADASRIYGLELEHILSSNRMLFFTNYNTLVEQHIPGIPGDIFIEKELNDEHTNKVRFAKEFVKFNEHCFIRLLGDMRSYNFVVNVTPDIEGYHYKIQAIDFDQQSYEGRKNIYLPQFFKDNYELVKLCLSHLNKESIEQYQAEERTLMTFRLVSSKLRMQSIMNIMVKDNIAPPEKVNQLKTELAEFYNQPRFLKCTTMGAVLKLQMKQKLIKNLQQIPKDKRHFVFR